MKKIFLIVLLSTNAIAANTDSAYVGGNLLVAHKTELDLGPLDGINNSGVGALDGNNDLGVGLFVGYNFAVHPNVDFGVELEYQHFGEVELYKGLDIYGQPSYLKADGNAFYLNARPKFINKGNNLYSALILGIGSLNGELKTPNSSTSDSEFSYQVGIEVGYMFNNIDISIGYRHRAAEFDGFDFEIQGATVGMRYSF